MKDLSIHSTTQVETNLFAEEGKSDALSIHSTTQVETDHVSESQIGTTLSIHSTTQVETFKNKGYKLVGEAFNPLHHTGGDGIFRCAIILLYQEAFNPLHHTGGDLPALGFPS